MIAVTDRGLQSADSLACTALQAITLPSRLLKYRSV
jgi:hypothetical protein